MLLKVLQILQVVDPVFVGIHTFSRLTRIATIVKRKLALTHVHEDAARGHNGVSAPIGIAAVAEDLLDVARGLESGLSVRVSQLFVLLIIIAPKNVSEPERRRPTVRFHRRLASLPAQSETTRQYPASAMLRFQL